MSAVINYSDNRSRQLDGRPQPDEVVAEEDVADPSKLARLLTRILRELTTLRRRWAPRSITYTNVPFGSSGTLRFVHKFGGSVNWQVVGWRDASDRPHLIEATGTDKNTLALVSGAAGTADLFVEERG